MLRNAASRLAVASRVACAARQFLNFARRASSAPAEHEPAEPAPATSAAGAIPFGKKARDAQILTSQTSALIAEAESLLGYPLLTYWTSPNGSICQADVLVFSQLLTKMQRAKGGNNKGPKGRVGLFLKSDGGHAEVSLRIIALLRGVFKHVTIFAPYSCASAATMMCLGADSVHMGATSYLTAVDTSLTHPLNPSVDGSRVSVSQDQIARVMRIWREQLPNVATESEEARNVLHALFKHIHPLVIGELDRSSSLSHRICCELLSYHMRDAAKAAEISRLLNHDYPSHSYPITLREAKRIGLPVRPLDPSLESILFDLNGLYATMSHRHLTDFSETVCHKNEILNILESRDCQVFYKVDHDSSWVTTGAGQNQSSRWVTLNDFSGWRVATLEGSGDSAETVVRDLHIK